MARVNSTILGLCLASYCLTTLADVQRIIGGNLVKSPPSWMVSLQYDSQHFCGGSLIGSQWVLTAAHCLEPFTPNQINLVIGANDRTKGQNTTGEHKAERHKAQWFYAHPSYNPETFLNDIAIIKLAKASSLAPIAIATPDLISVLPSSPSVTSFGWGTTKLDEIQLPKLLQRVLVNYQSDHNCQKIYGKSSLYWQRFMCAGEELGGKDSCKGDSGGPLVKVINGQEAQVGIVSWGEGCALRNKFGVYTEVPYYLDWIEQRRRGVTILGEKQLGFIGEGLVKSSGYEVVNLSESEKVISGVELTDNHQNIFATHFSQVFDPTHGYTFPAKTKCEFGVNATGQTLGRHTAQIRLKVEDDQPYDVTQSLTAFVLSTSMAQNFGTQWVWYHDNVSADPKNSIHSEYINLQNARRVKDQFINKNERIFLTYLDGPGNLKIKTKIHGQRLPESVANLAIKINRHNVDYLALKTDQGWNEHNFTLSEGQNEVLLSIKKSNSLNEDEMVVINQLELCSQSMGCSSGQEMQSIRSTVDQVNSCTAVNYNDSDLYYVNKKGELTSGKASRLNKVEGAGSLSVSIVWLMWVITFSFRLARLKIVFFRSNVYKKSVESLLQLIQSIKTASHRF